MYWNLNFNYQFQLPIPKFWIKLTNWHNIWLKFYEKYHFPRQNDAFLRFGGSVRLTEGSAEPVRPDFAEGSAEPFGSVVHYLFSMTLWIMTITTWQMTMIRKNRVLEPCSLCKNFFKDTLSTYSLHHFIFNFSWINIISTVM